MLFKGKINEMRRLFMHSLTRTIGQKDDIIGMNNLDIVNVLICRPNSRLGNQLLTTPIIQDISSYFPNCKIDVFVRGSAACAILKKYRNIDRIIRLPQKPFRNIIQYLYVWCSLRQKEYDLVINVDYGSSSGKLATKLSKSERKIFGVMDEKLATIYSDYMHMAKTSVYNLRKSLGIDPPINTAIPTLDMKLDSNEKKRGQGLLINIVNNNKATICIYTYATEAKCYSVEWWSHLYGMLKERYGQNYNIIEILPKENISQINFEAPTFYSMDLREIAALIANATLFIGADSGIMHLASSSGTRTIGLFSVSNMDRYQPYGTKNVGINTNNKSLEGILDIIDTFLTL